MKKTVAGLRKVKKFKKFSGYHSCKAKIRKLSSTKIKSCPSIMSRS